MLWLKDGVWHDRCVELLTSAAFNPGAVTSVSPSTLRHYLGLTTARQLYVTLIHLPCVPVGIWYRTDAAAYPHGELVSVYADGRGGYTMSPLDHNGRVLRQVELMRTDLRATSCACIHYLPPCCRQGSSSPTAAFVCALEHANIQQIETNDLVAASKHDKIKTRTPSQRPHALLPCCSLHFCHMCRLYHV